MDTICIHIVEFFQSSYAVFYVLTFVVAAVLLMSGLDDLALDLYYWFFYLFAPKTLRKYEMLPREELRSKAEKPIAIFIPAWHEADVIDRMLTRTCAAVQYKNYDVFVGVYPNDPETMEKVLWMARIYDQVHPVVANHGGPSSKAENLSALIPWAANCASTEALLSSLLSRLM